ncbi:hypothetical protein FQ377_01845 [Arthrobacter echini]|uniref:Type II secretion system protein GspF domain-containing protein n=1 Tax=Arthrobacter echini TaxID=1529066 RepID=A0A5D0XU78_9MICC|nr:hypothetical protein [Arthrobacter echini]TYD00228.1 hypothetical protein FQ377_01845 [Arthrobacter echini]
MTALLVAGLLSAACALWAPAVTAGARGSSRRLRARSQPEERRTSWLGILAGDVVVPRTAKSRRVDLYELTLFVHQLAGLLRAGRAPQLLWKDMEQLYRADTGAFSALVLPVLTSARRAAELGLGIPEVLGRERVAARGGPGDAEAVAQVERMWVELAACLGVSERSGAPLAAILEQYAVQLDAHLDGVSARDTALAGPRATVVLLSWLPAVGVVLGFALGVDPLCILVGSPLGRLALVSGLLLMLLSRIWSRKLVRRAAGAPP